MMLNHFEENFKVFFDNIRLLQWEFSTTTTTTTRQAKKTTDWCHCGQNSHPTAADHAQMIYMHICQPLSLSLSLVIEKKRWLNAKRFDPITFSTCLSISIQLTRHKHVSRVTKSRIRDFPSCLLTAWQKHGKYHFIETKMRGSVAIVTSDA